MGSAMTASQAGKPEAPGRHHGTGASRISLTVPPAGSHQCRPGARLLDAYRVTLKAAMRAYGSSWGW
jgi:hypothetical protein